MKSRSFDEALRCAGALLAADPQGALDQASQLAAGQPEPRVFRLVAAAHRALGQELEAAEAELQAIKSGFTSELRRAVMARESGRLRESRAIAEEYLTRFPDDLLAMTISAEAAMGMGQTEMAEAMLERVIGRAPAFARAGILIAKLLAAQARLRSAIRVVEELKHRLPNDLAVLRNLADLHAQVGEYAEAASRCADIIRAAPGNYADEVKYAQNLRAAGRKQESVSAFRRAVELSPTGGAAWWGLAQYFPETLDEADISCIRLMLDRVPSGSEDAGLLRIALSILHDRSGQTEEAFREISTVKAMHVPSPPYDPDVLTRHIDSLIAGFNGGLFPSGAVGHADTARPIFVVGMPRSGSTLVERIVGRHSLIEGAGEIQVLPRLVAAQLPRRSAGFGTLEPSALSREMVADIAGKYLERSRDFRRSAKPSFVDKFNGNWIHSGLIRLMFPRAKILDVRRNALDCCWSTFRMMFGDPYAHDQRHLARYFADYTRFMDAVDRAAPGGILSVSYEAVVDNTERETRRILSFLEVGWEPQCVDFHLSDQPVATPSSEQVRRPLFREGIGAAEPYRKWLGPLIDELTSLRQTGI